MEQNIEPNHDYMARGNLEQKIDPNHDHMAGGDGLDHNIKPNYDDGWRG